MAPSALHWNERSEHSALGPLTSLHVFGEGVFAVRQAYLGMEAAIERLDAHGQVQRFKGPFCAVVKTRGGILRVGIDGALDAIRVDGKIERWAEPPQGFESRLSAAAGWSDETKTLLVVGGMGSKTLLQDAWMYRRGLLSRKWSALPNTGLRRQRDGLLIHDAKNQAWMLAGGMSARSDAVFVNGAWHATPGIAFSGRATSLTQRLFEDPTSGHLFWARVPLLVGVQAPGEKGGDGSVDPRTTVFRWTPQGWASFVTVALPGDAASECAGLDFDAKTRTLIAFAQPVRSGTVARFECPLGEEIDKLAQPATRLAPPLPSLPPAPALPPDLNEAYFRRLEGYPDDFVFFRIQGAVLQTERGTHGRAGTRDEHTFAGPEAARAEMTRQALPLFDEGFVRVTPEEPLATWLRMAPLPGKPFPALLWPPFSLLKSTEPPTLPLPTGPACRHCGGPTTLYSSLAADPLSLPLQRSGALELWSCDECEDGECFEVRLAPQSHGHKLLKPEQKLDRAVGKVRSRTGGRPKTLQDVVGGRCDYCRAEMTFVAQIDDSLDTGLPLGDSGRCYLFVCPQEHQAKSRWDCY